MGFLKIMIIAIPLQKQSYYTELLFCLRSIEKYILNPKILIIGDFIPDWLTNVTQICVADIHGRKQLSIRKKILAALEYSKEILFMSDDVYLLKPYEKKYYSSGTLKQIGESGSKPLVKQLEALSKPIKNYDVHCPIIYKQDFKEVSKLFSSDCIIKSFYGNYLELPSVEMWDYKVNKKMSVEEIKKHISLRPYFSTGITGLQYALPVLEELFKNKSQFEL